MVVNFVALVVEPPQSPEQSWVELPPAGLSEEDYRELRRATWVAAQQLAAQPSAPGAEHSIETVLSHTSGQWLLSLERVARRSNLNGSDKPLA